MRAQPFFAFFTRCKSGLSAPPRNSRRLCDVDAPIIWKLIRHLSRQLIQFVFFTYFRLSLTLVLALLADRFQHLRVTDRSPTKPALALPHMSHKQYADSYRDDAVEDREDDELGYSYHHRRTASSGRLVAARADKPAVSARATNRARPVELPVEETSPPSSTSSDKPPAPATTHQQQQTGRRASDLLQEPVEPSRPASMLLQLIACGSTAPVAAGGGGGSGRCRAEPRRSCGLVSRLSARGGADEDEDEEEEAAGGELGRRFGHLAVENKEYFSGSIVEGAGGRGTPLPASSLKRSNSYNEER